MGVYAQTDYIKRGPFVSIWDTTKTGTGASGVTTIILPLLPAGSYAFYVDWGDGKSDYIDTWNSIKATHNYTASGIYTIKIRGMVNGFFQNSYGNTVDSCKLISITSWGCLNFKSLSQLYPPVTFRGCGNLNLNGLTDTPRLDNATDLQYLLNSQSINTVAFINSWDVSKIKNFYWMLPSGLWNDDISNWNVSSATDMSYMFTNRSAFNRPLSNWERTTPDVSTLANVKNMEGMFAGNSMTFNQDIGSWNVSGVTNFSSMFYVNEFFNNGGSSSINNWNTISATTMALMFQSSSAAITGFNQPIGNWNVSNVTSMSQMFSRRASFNQPLEAWNVSNVIYMNSMFEGAAAFNQPLAGWERNTPGNTSTMANVKYITSMFSSYGIGSSFNQPIGNWNTIGVEQMSNTFSGASSFNQPLNQWNTSNVLDMSGTFRDALEFNQPINQWDTSKVTLMSLMFYGALKFNQPIGNWNTSLVQYMNNMFTNAKKFNQPVETWNVSSLKGVSGMFGASFTDMEFNQPLGGWERSTPGNTSTTANITSFSNMFSVYTGGTGSSAFQQYIGNWNVSGVSGSTGFGSFMLGKTITTFPSTYLDNIYNGWITKKLSTYAGTGSFGALNFGIAKYTAAATQGRSLLTRAASLLPIVSVTNNGSGLIRIGATGHGLVTSNKAFIYDVTGTTEANGLWTITYVSANTLDLQGSTFTNAYVSGGSLRTGYGWAIIDGGI
jgi:surface protein